MTRFLHLVLTVVIKSEIFYSRYENIQIGGDASLFRVPDYVSIIEIRACLVRSQGFKINLPIDYDLSLRLQLKWGCKFQNTPLWSKILRMGCFGRKFSFMSKMGQLKLKILHSVNKFENEMFRSKMPYLGQKIRMWDIFKMPHLGRTIRNRVV